MIHRGAVIWGDPCDWVHLMLLWFSEIPMTRCKYGIKCQQRTKLERWWCKRKMQMGTTRYKTSFDLWFIMYFHVFIININQPRVDTHTSNRVSIKTTLNTKLEKRPISRKQNEQSTTERLTCTKEEKQYMYVHIHIYICIIILNVTKRHWIGDDIVVYIRTYDGKHLICKMTYFNICWIAYIK